MFVALCALQMNNVAFAADYKVHRDWNDPVRLRSVSTGASFESRDGTLGSYMHLGQVEVGPLLVRGATFRSTARTGQLDLGAVGLWIPPYLTEHVEPYVLYHWDNSVEAGIHFEVLPKDTEHIGLDVFSTVPLNDPKSYTVSAGVSLGDWRDSFEPSDFELRVGTFGVTGILGEGLGWRGSLLEGRLGPVSTSVVDVSIAENEDAGYFSFLPLGVVLPPSTDVVEFQYRFHWAPMLDQSSTGVHVLEMTIDPSGEGEGQWLLHATVEGGNDNRNQPWTAGSVSLGWGSL